MPFSTTRALITRVRLFVGDTKETRFTDADIVQEMNNSLEILSEAIRLDVNRMTTLKILSHQTVYNLPENTISTTRFEQMFIRTKEFSSLGAVDLTDIQVVNELDIYERNFERTSAIKYESPNNFRDDTSETVISAIMKSNVNKNQIEIYPKLTGAKTVVTDESKVLIDQDEFLEQSLKDELTVGDHDFALLRVFYSSYFEFNTTDMDVPNTFGHSESRTLEHLTAANLLMYDTNSSSQEKMNLHLTMYRTELANLKKRKGKDFHDQKRTYKIRRRRTNSVSEAVVPPNRQRNNRGEEELPYSDYFS